MKSLLLALLLLPASARAQKVAAVLSSELPAYQEALDGFLAAHGSTVPVLSYADRHSLPNGAQIVVAFGSRASLASYPKRVRVIAVAAPAAESYSGRHSLVTVRLLPRPERLVSAARKALPGVSRLGVLWVGPALDDYMDTMTTEAGGAGLTIVERRLDSSDDLPDALRHLEGRIDALWLPPDPSLLTPRNFSLLVSFAKSAQIPLYGPTPGLTERGATGCLGVTFRSAGRSAADMVRRALSGETPPRFAYSEDMDLVFLPALSTGPVRTAP